jgi:hypothetical protein
MSSLPRATNYCSRANQREKLAGQKWIVTAIYANPSLNTEYLYRTASGAEKQVAYLRQMIAADARRSLGCEIPMVDVTIRSKEN